MILSHSIENGSTPLVTTNFMNDVDEKINEMVQNMILVDTELKKRFGNFNMKDVMLSQPMMKDVPSKCVFPMDFKYEKR
jgi:hypothetical protein